MICLNVWWKRKFCIWNHRKIWVDDRQKLNVWFTYIKYLCKFFDEVLWLFATFWQLFAWRCGSSRQWTFWWLLFQGRLGAILSHLLSLPLIFKSQFESLETAIFSHLLSDVLEHTSVRPEPAQMYLVILLIFDLLGHLIYIVDIKNVVNLSIIWLICIKTVDWYRLFRSI